MMRGEGNCKYEKGGSAQKRPQEPSVHCEPLFAGPGGGKQALDDCTSSAHPWRPGNLKPTVRKAYTIVLPVCQSGLAVRFSRLAGTGVACRTPLSLSVFFYADFTILSQRLLYYFVGTGAASRRGWARFG